MPIILPLFFIYKYPIHTSNAHLSGTEKTNINMIFSSPAMSGTVNIWYSWNGHPLLSPTPTAQFRKKSHLIHQSNSSEIFSSFMFIVYLLHAPAIPLHVLQLWNINKQRKSVRLVSHLSINQNNLNLFSSYTVIVYLLLAWLNLFSSYTVIVYL